MSSADLLLACLLDAIIGDPRWLPHPVRIMGMVINWYERWVRMLLSTPAAERAAGVALALGLPAGAYAGGWILIDLAGRHGPVGKAVEIWLACTTLAARDLIDHAHAVRSALMDKALPQAKAAVGMLVGRDTANLPEAEIVRATVESVAESTCDGVLAPLLYLVIGGPPLALAYKAVNTLDSMIGHWEPPYRHFGWASARLDDIANWIPARLTAILLAVAAGFVARRARRIARVWSIVRRDGWKHPSPNSGWPEAAMAGALGVQLGGSNWYGGVLVARPLLGDPISDPSPHHVSPALVHMIVAYVLAVLAATLVLL